MPERRTLRGFLAGLALVFLLPLTLHAASLNATLDRDTVSVGDAATLTLTFEGATPKNPPSLPGVQDLRISYGGQSSQFSWVNGESKSTVTFTYELAPTQPGNFNIPPIEVKVGNDTLRSPPIQLRAVRAEAATPDSTGAEEQLVLLKLVVPRKQIYLGEVVPVELDLYLRDRVLNVQQSVISPFSADGFRFGQQIQGQQKQARVGNAVFNVIPLYSTMTAGKTGSFTISPVDATLVVVLPAAGQQKQRDPFDPFGAFQRNEAKRVTLSSQAENIEVLPLPDGAPDNFNGAVGTYSFAMSAAPTDVVAGDPVTVKIQINGRGALDVLTLPEQKSWGDFKIYPPTAKVQTTDQLGLQGTKNFELVVIPQNPEVRALPPFEFSYFDPEQKNYKTIKQAAIALNVRPAAANTALPTLAGKTEPAAPKADLAPIKLKLNATGKAAPLLVKRPVFWTLQSLPVLAWSLLLVRRKRAESLANNPRLLRQRAVAQAVHNGLADLRRLAAEKNSDGFFATLFHLLQEQLGERLGVPASSITESVIDDQLRPRGADEAELARLHELFQACNLARYAPVKSSHELEAFIPRLQVVLEELKGLKR